MIVITSCRLYFSSVCVVTSEYPWIPLPHFLGIGPWSSNLDSYTLSHSGAPGQGNWMPTPQVPMGCPPGLEYLTAIDQVIIQQQIELLEGNLKGVNMFFVVFHCWQLW